ncbi:hypothetical protein VE04_00559 [Pseudogymnoascus sp. 24MN13]|nr:hypothetical protein VE04_00559 [Pseudogymnoascus sp. 24MN13]
MLCFVAAGRAIEAWKCAVDKFPYAGALANVLYGRGELPRYMINTLPKQVLPKTDQNLQKIHWLRYTKRAKTTQRAVSGSPMTWWRYATSLRQRSGKWEDAASSMEE